MNTPRILIIGGGFAGIFCAKKLHKLFGNNAKITLVSNKPHFEYHAALYRVVNEGTPLQACVPLRDILKQTTVEIIIDTIEKVDFTNNTAYNTHHEKYLYDYIILSLGSENSYLGIPGISKYSYSMRTIPEALKLAHHIHETLEEHKESEHDRIMEIAVVGSGPSGVELAGELAFHTQEVATKHRLPQSAVQIELIEAQNRILPILSESDSQDISDRLRAIGVKISTNTKVQEGLEIGLKTDNGTIKTKTVIWTAGAQASKLYAQWGLSTNKTGRVEVNKYLQAQTLTNSIPGQQAYENLQSNSKVLPNVFITGDGANVQGAGQALPAKIMGELAAQNIYNIVTSQPLKSYQPPIPLFIMPVGRNWAYAKISIWTFKSLLGFLIHKLWTYYFFSMLLSPYKAFTFLKHQHQTCDICQVCMHNYQQKLY